MYKKGCLQGPSLHSTLGIYTAKASKLCNPSQKIELLAGRAVDKLDLA